MIIIKNKSNDPFFNLSLEEYTLKHLYLKEDIIILWQNEPTVVVGRNQNTIEEINSDYIKENDINVVRRLSGGGAVFHDLGNLNFTFITENKKDNANNFKKFTQPLIDTLAKIDIEAEFSGRNDVLVDGKKISGNAQYYYKNKMLHHGTILFNANLGILKNVLNVKLDKIESKGIKSVRSRVTNIYPYLKEELTIEEFKSSLTESFFNTSDSQNNEYILSDIDLANIRKMMEDRYLTWDWVYGKSPEFNIQKTKRFTGGNLDIRLNVRNGIIKGCRIYGDFFGENNLDELEKAICEKKYEENIIRELLNSLEFEKYFYNISIDNFINCIF